MNGFCMAVVCVALNSGAANKTTRKSCKEQTSRKIKKNNVTRNHLYNQQLLRRGNRRLKKIMPYCGPV